MGDKKIIHIMKSLADSDGIPNFSYFVPYFLEDYGYDNCILLTRNSVLPVSEKLELIPPTKYVPRRLMIIKELISQRPDILIIYHHFGSPLAVIWLLISKVLHIKTIAQPDINEYVVPRSRKSIFMTCKEILKWILLYSQIHLFDTIVGATKYEIDTLSRICEIPKEKYRIIPWGMDFEIGSSEKGNYILSISKWWRDRKNLHTALCVFSKVIKEYDCTFVIVGKFLKGEDDEVEIMYDKKMTGEDYESHIKNLIEELCIKEHVIFTGVVSPDDLKQLYREAKIYYMPAKFETFGGVFVEAMASGTPQVAMRNSAVKYVVKDGVTGFLRDTEEGQKDVILRLLVDDCLYKQIQENCLDIAIGYKWDNVITYWVQLINEAE